MGFECFGCHQKFDTKGPFSRHQLKFKQEAQHRRTNYSLSIREPQVEDPPVAGGSNFPGALQPTDSQGRMTRRMTQMMVDVRRMMVQMSKRTKSSNLDLLDFDSTVPKTINVMNFL